MTQANRKKLRSIKAKVLNDIFYTMEKQMKKEKVDEDYQVSLGLLGKALSGIEEKFGDLD